MRVQCSRLGLSKCPKHPPAQTTHERRPSLGSFSAEIVLLGESSGMPVTGVFDTCKTCFSYILYIYMFMYLYVFFMSVYIHAYTFWLTLIKTFNEEVAVTRCYRGNIRGVRCQRTQSWHAPQTLPSLKKAVKARGSLALWKGLPHSQVWEQLCVPGTLG